MRIRSGQRSLTCTDVHGPELVGPLAVQAGPWRGSVSAMKKLINSVDNVVTDALRGMAAAHPHELDVDLDQHIVYRRHRKEEGKVAIISDGGSGHEPLHGGFVGTGMLDAACAGDVYYFSSICKPKRTPRIATTTRIYLYGIMGAGTFFIRPSLIVFIGTNAAIHDKRLAINVNFKRKRICMRMPCYIASFYVGNIQNALISTPTYFFISASKARRLKFINT